MNLLKEEMDNGLKNTRGEIVTIRSVSRFRRSLAASRPVWAGDQFTGRGSMHLDVAFGGQ
jgi:hypothetical protein